MNTREFKGVTRWAVVSLTIIVGLYSILYYSGLFPTIGVYILRQPHTAFWYGFMLALTFLLYPAGKGMATDKLPWYDVVLAVISVAPTWYVAFNYGAIQDHMALATYSLFERVFAVLLILFTLEAARRTVGWGLVGFGIFFAVHPLIAGHLPWILHGRSCSIEQVTSYMYLFGEGMLGMANGIAATIIMAFIVFSQFLQATGAGRFFVDAAFSVFGRWRGGPAKGAIVGSGLFGMVSGSGLANVATVGTVTIPAMKKAGYSPEFAGGIEAVASNGGQIMPPVMGAVAFVMAEMLGMSYGAVCIAAFLPAALYYLGLFVQVDLEAARRGFKGLPRAELPSAKKVLQEGWPYVIPFIVLVYLLMGPGYSPEKAAWWALVALIVVSSFRKESRLTLRGAIDAFGGVAKIMCLVGAACAGAGILIASIGLTGLGLRLSSDLLTLSGGNLPLLLVLTAIASFVLGLGLSSLPCYIMIVILIAPALIQLGVIPIAAHLFAFWFAIASFITPPVCECAFAAAAIAGGDMMKTGWQATRLGIVTFIIPFMFCYNPQLLLIGSPVEVGIAVITSVVGVILLSMGVRGFALTEANWLQRILFISAALLLVWPGWLTDIAGAVIGAVVILWQFRQRRTRGDLLKAATSDDKQPPSTTIDSRR